ncbi:MAG: hypothetical protein DRG78_23075 [Epsilonproteobacteria bacterium]|nr:MAG: hypothetical protein DRG78_23075 [Campylobacterota bacterium]
MSKLPIVLLVHGMGTHPLDNMTKDFKAGLNEAAKGFGVNDFNIDEHMEIVEFNYSESLDKIRKKLAEQSQDIIAQFDMLPGAGTAVEIVKKLLEFQSNLDKDEEIYTHWLDVLLYGATFYGEPIRIELAKKINNIQKRAAGRDIHIVAHSLGTAVVHDTLNKLYRDEATSEDDIPDLIPGIDNIKCLWTFANVNRLVHILNGIAPNGSSVVRSGPNGCTDYLYNIYHELDPFTMILRYEPTIENGKNFVNHVVRNINTHNFTEYVADPEVSQYMLLQMTNLQEPKSMANFEAYKQKHREGEINGLYDKMKVEFKEIHNLEIDSVEDLFVLIQEFVKKVKELTNVL